MAKQPASQAPQPGAYFRVPKLGTRRRFLREGGNGAVGFLRSQGASIQAQTFKFDQLDIVRGYLLMLKLNQTYTAGAEETLHDSPFFPFNMVDSLSVQFESSYKTFNLPGWLAAIMQSYRPSFSNQSGMGMLSNVYANHQQPSDVNPNATWNQPSLLTGDNMTDQTAAITIPFEIPTSMEFDLYWELDLAGNPQAVTPRAVVSPQYMAATTRNVIPRLVLAQGLTVEDLLNGPVSVASGDTTSTFVDNGSEADFYRDCWFPAPVYATPPVHPWQYSRDYIEYPTSGQNTVPIPLDADTAGQGQILSVVGMTWDPDLASGFGGPVPLSSYQELDLVYSSKLTIFEDTPETNQARWLANHGTLLPPGCFGWDLALTEDGKLTNEDALNTLVEAGCQIRTAYNTGESPSATATTYVGIEILKAVNG
jgi:hypothetical protein